MTAWLFEHRYVAAVVIGVLAMCVVLAPVSPQLKVFVFALPTFLVLRRLSATLGFRRTGGGGDE